MPKKRTDTQFLDQVTERVDTADRVRSLYFETEVLRMILEGQSLTSIAKELGTTVKDIRQVRLDIMTALTEQQEEMALRFQAIAYGRYEMLLSTAMPLALGKQPDGSLRNPDRGWAQIVLKIIEQETQLMEITGRRMQEADEKRLAANYDKPDILTVTSGDQMFNEAYSALKADWDEHALTQNGGRIEDADMYDLVDAQRLMVEDGVNPIPALPDERRIAGIETAIIQAHPGIIPTADADHEADAEEEAPSRRKKLTAVEKLALAQAERDAQRQQARRKRDAQRRLREERD